MYLDLIEAIGLGAVIRQNVRVGGTQGWLDIQLYGGEGKDPRCGVIDFAIGADVAQAFRAAVQATAETEWNLLIRMVEGKPRQTDQKWAEICFLPSGAGYSLKRADDRFLTIREPLRQLPLGDEAQWPFPTQDFGQKGPYKLFSVVTNQTPDTRWLQRPEPGFARRAAACEIKSMPMPH